MFFHSNLILSPLLISSSWSKFSQFTTYKLLKTAHTFLQTTSSLKTTWTHKKNKISNKIVISFYRHFFEIMQLNKHILWPKTAKRIRPQNREKMWYLVYSGKVCGVVEPRQRNAQKETGMFGSLGNQRSLIPRPWPRYLPSMRLRNSGTSGSYICDFVFMFHGRRRGLNLMNNLIQPKIHAST